MNGTATFATSYLPLIARVVSRAGPGIPCDSEKYKFWRGRTC